MRILGFYLTTKEQWDIPNAFLTLRRKTPNRNRRIAVIIKSAYLAKLTRDLEELFREEENDDDL